MRAEINIRLTRCRRRSYSTSCHSSLPGLASPIGGFSSRVVAVARSTRPCSTARHPVGDGILLVGLSYRRTSPIRRNTGCLTNAKIAVKLLFLPRSILVWIRRIGRSRRSPRCLGGNRGWPSPTSASRFSGASSERLRARATPIRDTWRGAIGAHLRHVVVSTTPTRSCREVCS